MKKITLFIVIHFFINAVSAQSPWGCNVQAIRDSFASRGVYTELLVPTQPCNLYFIDSRDRDATLTEADARTLGGHMAVIDNSTENFDISAALWAAGYTNGGKVLIGYRRTGYNGAFLPTDGTTPLGYTQWDAGRPDNQLPGCRVGTSCSFCFGANLYQCINGEQCVEMTPSGYWNDLQCEQRGAKSLIKVSLCPNITANNDTAICPGATVNINTAVVKGSTPYGNYLWSNGATTQNISVSPVTTTTYTMTVTDRYSCKDTESVVVNILPGSAVSFSVSPAALCESDTATVTLSSAVNPSATYNWNFGGATVLSGTGVGPYRVLWATAGTKTVSLTLSGTACGSVPVTQNVTVAAKPTANAGRDTTLCNGNSVQLGMTPAAGVTYTWSPTTDLSNAAIGNPTYTNTGAVPSTVTLVLTATQSGCSVKDTVIINNISSVTTSFTTSAATICQSDTVTVTYTGNGTAMQTYNWNFGGGAVLSGTGSGPYRIKWNTSGTKNISLSISGGGCSAAVTTQQVVVNASPVANAGRDTTLCNGNSVQLGMTPAAGVAYTWSPATDLSNAAIGNPTYTNTGAVPSTVTFVLTATQSGCAVKDTVIINNISSVTTSFTTSAATICQSDTVTVTYTGNGTAMQTYNWNFGGGAVLSGTGSGPYRIKWNTSGTKNISLSISGGGCSAAVTTQQVMVNAVPVANAGSDANVCSGKSVTLGSSAVPGVGYTWTPATNLNSAAVAQPIFSAINNTGAAVIQSYILTATQNGCAVKDTVLVTLVSSLSGNFTVSQNAVCQYTPVQFLYAGNATAGAVYHWSFDNGTVVSGSGQGPIEVSWSTTGVKSISLWVEQNSCLSDTITRNVTITQGPVATAGNDIVLCSGGTDTLGASAVSATAIYSWTNGNAIQQLTIAQPTVTYRNNLATPLVETYIVTVTDNGCSAKDTVTVTVNPNQNAVVQTNGSTSRCIGETLLLFPDRKYSTVIWSNGATADTLQITTDGAFGYEAVDSNGCVYISNIVNATFSSSPTLILDSIVAVRCTGQSNGKIYVSATGGTPGYFFSWSGGNGSPAIGLAAGQYTITVSDLNNCKDSATYTVGVSNSLSVDTVAVSHPSCFGFRDGSIAVSAQHGDLPYTFLWNTSASGSTISGLGAGTYSVVVTDGSLCTATTSVVLTEPSDFLPTISNATTVLIGESTVLDLSVSPAGSYSYIWTPGSSLSCIGCEDPTANPMTATTYIVTVTENTTGCVKTATTTVKVDNTKKYYLPTAFSPNNDGVNDVLLLYTNAAAVKEFELRVFNRWGEELFFTNNVAKGWDGTYNGKAMNNGVYILQYRITFIDGQVVNHKGSVTIVK